jgi:hypothetical protein
MTFQDLCRTLPEDVVYLIRDFAVAPHPVGQLFMDYKEWVLDYEYMRGREATQTEHTEANINEKWNEFMESIFISYTYSEKVPLKHITEWLKSSTETSYFEAGTLSNSNYLLKEKNEYIMRWHTYNTTAPLKSPSPLMIRLSIRNWDYDDSDALNAYPMNFVGFDTDSDDDDY